LRRLITVRNSNQPKIKSQIAKNQIEKMLTRKAGKKGGKKQPPTADDKKNYAEQITVRKPNRPKAKL